MEITILIILISLTLLHGIMNQLENRKRITALERKIPEKAEEAAREIVKYLFSGEDETLQRVPGNFLGLRRTEAQEKLKEFIISCITDGVEGSKVIMESIDKRYERFESALELWGSDEFIKLLVERINEFQLK